MKPSRPRLRRGRGKLKPRNRAVPGALLESPPLVETCAMTAAAIPANAQERYEVTREQLPVSCPMPGMSAWNSHPKIYLPMAANGEARCPYCSALYVLKD